MEWTGMSDFQKTDDSACAALRPPRISRRGREWRDHRGEFEKEVDDHFQAGKLKNKETVAGN
jgi:hypothetical protein